MNIDDANEMLEAGDDPAIVAIQTMQGKQKALYKNVTIRDSGWVDTEGFEGLRTTYPGRSVVWVTWAETESVHEDKWRERITFDSAWLDEVRDKDKAFEVV